jgi:dihydrodipicolinate synthase/N-acetylneuraminate lyase
MTDRLAGAVVAAVTPMASGGRTIDVGALGSMTSFFADAGLDGVLACGTTGEGVLLHPDERRQITEAFVAARPAGFRVAVHAGAQSTADTVALAAHAQEAGADAVAVIAPPYFPLDDDELERHFVSAANACDPLPFYVYEFAGRSGYTIPPAVVTRIRAESPNVVGMKVSDTPYDAVRPYLDLGLDVFVGQEPLALQGMADGAVGTVSGLAAAFPEIVASLVHERSRPSHEAVTKLRDGLVGIPFHAALKEILVARDVLMDASVRPPLRGLTGAERDAVLTLAREVRALG